MMNTTADDGCCRQCIVLSRMMGAAAGDVWGSPTVGGVADGDCHRRRGVLSPVTGAVAGDGCCRLWWVLPPMMGAIANTTYYRS